MATGSGGKTTPADLGAAWIHGVVGNPITTLVGQAKVALSKATNYENDILLKGATAVPDATFTA